MNDLFSKRMGIILKSGSLGARLVEESETIEDKLFHTDINYREGTIYDWNMAPLDKVEFKFEKAKTYTAEGYDVEYYVHFRPGFNPEYKYKDRYYKNDSKERLGFYIDVYNYPKKIYEKWLIVGKDDRTSFDRYNVFKCNWCLEWVIDNKYYNCVCVVRNANDANFNAIDTDDLGGSSIEGDVGVILPSNADVSKIKFGSRFIISDSPTRPQVYQSTKIKDVAQVGVTKLYLDQHLFNGHTDYQGIIDENTDTEFVFDSMIPDLPNGFGNQYHMICNCIKTKGLPTLPKDNESEWIVSCNERKLYYNGTAANIRALSDNEGFVDNSGWHFIVDGEEYTVEELEGYFEILISENMVSVKCINKDMVNYHIEIALYGKNKTYYSSVVLEVCL